MTNLNINNKIDQKYIEQRTAELLDLSEIVYQFIDVKRATIRHNRPETDGEHTLHLQMIAISYALRYYPHLDIGKISLYAMVHDFVEVFAGDVNSLTASPSQLATKNRTEAAAYNRLKQELGERWPGLIRLVYDYESFADSEARYVKIFDKCDPSFTHIKDRGQALKKMGVLSQQQFNSIFQVASGRLTHLAAEFPDILAIRESLGRRVADTAEFTVY